MGAKPILYSYFRSSASFRVRIALNYKKVPYEYVPVHLLNNGGEQNKPEFAKLNPMRQVPLFIHNDKPLTQSLAIIQYLEELYPTPPLFPSAAYDRAAVWQICEIINSGIQPLQNTSVTTELTKNFGLSEEQKAKWLHLWIGKGMDSLNQLLGKTAGEYCYGDMITAADCCLVPQVVSSKRFGVDPVGYKHIMRVYENAMQDDAFVEAEPSRQPDAT